MRIALVIPALEAGGAEKVFTAMANYWVEQGETVDAITWDDGSRAPFFPLNENVHRTRLAILKRSESMVEAARNNMRRIRKMKATLRALAPDIVISFLNQTNIVTLLAARQLRNPVIVSERSNPESYSLGFVWEKLRRHTYNWAASVVVLNEVSASYYRGRIRTPIEVVPNPIVIDQTIAADDSGLPRPVLVGMGRLKREKNFHLLIRAFAALARVQPDWTLVIIGDGPLRAELEVAARTLGVGDRVVFTGFVKQPHRLLRNADLFVLSSITEGFPCALIEAMACGLPVISTQYHEGVRDIVAHGKNGLIVKSNDEDGMIAALGVLMSDAEKRRALALGARGIVERFSIDHVMERWGDVIEKATGSRPGTRRGYR